MILVSDVRVTFQEVPDEISLSLSLSKCKNFCVGCHSEHLRKDYGDVLTLTLIDNLLKKNKFITCVIFLGEGDSVEDLVYFSNYIKSKGKKTTLYSGRLLEDLDKCVKDSFDYLKVGPFIKKYGGLKNINTNQRFYKLPELIDLTYKFNRI